MQIDTTQRYHSFFVFFNSQLIESEWSEVGNKTQNYYVDFLNSNDYGDDLLSTTFNFIVEKEIDIDKQEDIISTSSYLGIPKYAKLNIHLDYDTFTKSTDTEKFKIAINGILFLLKHWESNLKIPKGNPLKNIIKDFLLKLKIEKLLLNKEELGKVFFKIINPFRFNFMLYNRRGIGEKQILFDTNEIEFYFNNRLYKEDFGKSISEVNFSYDILDFNNGQTVKGYIDNEKKYQYGRTQNLSFMKQYDSNRFLYNELNEEQTKLGQVKYLHEGLLNAILRIDNMKRKPKYFDVGKFYTAIDALLKEYEHKYCS